MKTNSSILKAASRKLGLSFLLAASAVVAFATLGDGKSSKEKPRKLLTNRSTAVKPGSFSLQTGYTFRGSQVMNTEPTTRYINLNAPVVTYQQGHAVYVLPARKKVTLNLNAQKNQVPGAGVNINF